MTARQFLLLLVAVTLFLAATGGIPGK